MGVGRCAWEAVYSTDSSRSKPSSAVSTLWRLALVSDDDWKTASAAVTNGSLKASRKMNRSFGLLYNFSFLWGPVCERAGVIRQDQYIFLLKKQKTTPLTPPRCSSEPPWAPSNSQYACCSIINCGSLPRVYMSLNRKLFIYLARNKTILNKTPKSPGIKLVGPIAGATTLGNCYNCKRAALLYKRLADHEAGCTLTSCSTLVFEGN